jgi:hypothetical protein
MRDRRDYVIAALAAALLFFLGIAVGNGGSLLPAARAQDTFDPEQPIGGGAASPGGTGVSINPNRSIRPGFESGTSAVTASDSDSNNRFVAVTAPIGSGESVLFLIDSKNDQLVVYRYERRKGLVFLAGRKIDYDLKILGYEDHSKFSRDEMKRLHDDHAARKASKAAKKKKK